MEAITGTHSAVLFQGLKLVVEVAVHISPLALLNSINYSHFSIDRRLMMKVISYISRVGKPRPHCF